MKLSTLTKPLVIAALALTMASFPAFAQQDDDAVEATQEELDAVGGLRGKEKAPTLESVDTPPASNTSESSASQASNDENENASATPEGLTVNLRVGLGFSAMQTPGFNSDFSVRDDSPSRSIYSFSADVPATDSQTHFSAGFNILWDTIDPVRAGFLLDISYAPLTWDGAGIFAFSVGPSLEVNATDSIIVGASLGVGLVSYQLGFDVDAASGGDSYMTFDDTDIYFDEDGLAEMTVRKSGFLLTPELSVAYQASELMGFVFRVQYFDHYIDTEAPWELQFRETDDNDSSEGGSTADSVEVSYEGEYVVDGSELPKVFDFSGLAYQIQWQLRF